MGKISGFSFSGWLFCCSSDCVRSHAYGSLCQCVCPRLWVCVCMYARGKLTFERNLIWRLANGVSHTLQYFNSLQNVYWLVCVYGMSTAKAIIAIFK